MTVRKTAALAAAILVLLATAAGGPTLLLADEPDDVLRPTPVTPPITTYPPDDMYYGLDLKVSGPPEVEVGNDATFEICITNGADKPVSGGVVVCEFDDGLVHTTAPSPLERDLGLVGPRETRRVGIRLRATEPGRRYVRVRIKGERGDLTPVASACVQAIARQLAGRVAVELDDGSCVLGKITAPETLTLATDHGKLTAGWETLMGVEIAREHGFDRLLFTNGDRMTGELAAAELTVQSRLGELTLDLAKVAAISSAADQKWDRSTQAVPSSPVPPGVERGPAPIGPHIRPAGPPATGPYPPPVGPAPPLGDLPAPE